jgi:4-amino-4-deoxy-L-arabinose transferase-like glycosyltransferase
VSASTAAPTVYRPPPWQEALTLVLPERWLGERAYRWVGRLPLVLATLILAAMTLFLRNGASTDEALNVNAGHAYVIHWITGNDVDQYGQSFPGTPFVYPVIAGALDSVGGLFLVRAFSLACVLVAAVLLAATVAGHSSRRAGYLTAIIFATTGPVAVVGGLGTPDALVLLLLSAALWLGTSCTGTASVLGSGLLLGLAPIVKYASVVLVPVVLVAVLFMAPRERVRRSTIAAATALAVITSAWLAWADIVRGGVRSTTWSQHAVNPLSRAGLVGWLTLDVGILLLVALAGACILLRGRRRDTLLAGALLCGGLVVPMGQIRIGESVSFDRNLAYSALFLAPLAGMALASLSRRTWKIGPVILVVAVALLFGVSRSAADYDRWTDVAPVVASIEGDPQPGLYFASGSAVEPLRYYTRHLPGVQWENTYGLYAKGDDAVRVAIEDLHFHTIVLHTAPTGSSVEDARQAVMLRALHDNSKDYQLAASMPVDSKVSTDTWLIYEQVRGAP